MPQAQGAPLRQVRNPLRSSKAGREPHAAPTLGEHTDEVLRELGLSPHEIQQHRSEGIV